MNHFYAPNHSDTEARLMDVMGDYQPVSMMADFELAPRNAFHKAFPEAIWSLTTTW